MPELTTHRGSFNRKERFTDRARLVTPSATLAQAAGVTPGAAVPDGVCESHRERTPGETPVEVPRIVEPGLPGRPSGVLAEVQAGLVDPANDVFLSAASAWEIAVKHGLGRLRLRIPPDEYVPRQRRLHRIESG